MNLWVDEQRLVGAQARRHPGLYFRWPERGSPMHQFAEHFVLHSVYDIVDQPAPSRSGRVRTAATEDLLNTEKQLESQFTSSSLGVIAEVGDGFDAILRIPLDGQAGGEVPGAIASSASTADFPRRVCGRWTG